MNDIPPELFGEMYQYFTFGSIFNLSMTCKKFNIILSKLKPQNLKSLIEECTFKMKSGLTEYNSYRYQSYYEKGNVKIKHGITIKIVISLVLSMRIRRQISYKHNTVVDVKFFCPHGIEIKIKSIQLCTCEGCDFKFRHKKSFFVWTGGDGNSGKSQYKEFLAEYRNQIDPIYHDLEFKSNSKIGIENFVR